MSSLKQAVNYVVDSRGIATVSGQRFLPDRAGTDVKPDVRVGNLLPREFQQKKVPTALVWPNNDTNVHFINFTGVADTVAELVLQAGCGAGESTIERLAPR